MASSMLTKLVAEAVGTFMLLSMIFTNVTTNTPLAFVGQGAQVVQRVAEFFVLGSQLPLRSWLATTRQVFDEFVAAGNRHLFAR